MKYRDYTIGRAGDNFYVQTPRGHRWQEIAVNLKTAKRWIDQRIAELGGKKDW